MSAGQLAGSPAEAPASGREPPRSTKRAGPFQGLAYFEQRDAGAFGGRARDIRELASEILKNRKLIMYGRSGLGKTSLLLAGVFPKLHEMGCKTVYVRALLDPVRDLFDAAHAQLAGNGQDDLFALIEQRGSAGPVVIVFDQFEEFFIRFAQRRGALRGDVTGQPERQSQLRESFLEHVTRLASATELDVRLVFSLREDWFAEMESFEEALPGIMRSAYRLLPLTAFGVRESITRMLKVFDVAFDARLVSGLVEVLAEVNFDPAVLQVMCAELWKEAQIRCHGAVDRLSLADLEKVGNVSELFARYLDEVIAHIPGDDASFLLRVRAVVASMITPQGTKLAAPRSHFLQLYFEIDAAELERVLALLEDQRLIRRDDRQDEPWFELIHERLIESVTRWLERDAAFFRFRAALNTVRTLSASPGWRQDPDRLLNPGQLEGVVGPYRQLLRFEEHERLFLLHSAVCAGSEDLRFWAQQNPQAELEALVDTLAISPVPALRIKACEAIGELESLAHLRPTLRQLALEDATQEVRRVAARTFARGVSALELEQLRAWLDDHRGSEHGLDLVAEMLRLGTPEAARSFDLLRRLRAGRRLATLQLREKAAAISAAQDRIRFALPAAAAVWTFGVTPPLTLTALCVAAPTLLDNRDWLAWVSGVGVWATVVAFISGWWVTRRGISFAAQRGEEFQIERAFQLRGLIVVVGVASWLALCVSLLAEEKEASIIWAVISCVPLLIAWTSCLARFARPSVWRAPTLLRRWLWALVWSLGGTLGPALLMWLLSGSRPALIAAGWPDDDAAPIVLKVLYVYPVVAFFCSPTVATAAFSGLATLSATSPLHGRDAPQRLAPDPELSTATVRRSRWAGAVLFGTALVTFSWAHGIDVFPLASREVALEPGKSDSARLVLEPGPALVDTVFARVDLESTEPHVVRYERRSLDYRAARANQYQLYPPGSSRLPAVHWERSLESAPSVTLELDVLRQVERGKLVEAGWHFYPVRFEPDEGSASSDDLEWHGTLNLEVASPATTLELCSTGYASWPGQALDVLYGERGRPEPGRPVLVRSEPTELTPLLRPPAAELQLGDFWSDTTLACASIAIDSGSAHAELPPLRRETGEGLDLSEKSLRFRRESIQHLFLVRAR